MPASTRRHRKPKTARASRSPATLAAASMDCGVMLATPAPRAGKIRVLGPAEAPLSVVRGRYRVRLLVKAAREADIQAYLRQWLDAVPPPKGSLRLTVDIDPYNFM